MGQVRNSMEEFDLQNLYPTPTPPLYPNNNMDSPIPKKMENYGDHDFDVVDHHYML